LGTSHKDIWILWLSALVLRIAYLLLTVDHLGSDGLWTVIPDTSAYRSVADELVGGGHAQRDWLFFVGPGYGLILAALRTVFGSSAIPAALLNVLLGSAAPVLVYLLTMQLIGKRAVALSAGVISAISSTSLSLSAAVTTDQPFFTIHCAALVCFVLGLRRGWIGWFIYAGIAGGLACHIRSVSQLWPLVFCLVPLLIPVQERFRSRLSMVRFAALTGCIMLVTIFAWGARNYVVHDVFTFGGNGMRAARSYLAAETMASHTDQDLEDVRAAWTKEDDTYFGGRELTVGQRHRRNTAHLLETVSSHPGWTAQTFLSIVWDNILEGNVLPLAQVSFLHPMWDRLYLSRILISETIFYLTLLGLFFLTRDRLYMPLVILGITYAYFTLITGFSFWQGSRLHYPAEMAWSILVAYALWRLIDVGKQFIQSCLRHRAADKTG